MSDLITRLRSRTDAILPEDWKKDRRCPSCDTLSDRPKCLFEDPGCPRNDPYEYDDDPHVEIPNALCQEAADRIAALESELAEARQALRDLVADTDSLGWPQERPTVAAARAAIDKAEGRA